MEAAKRMMNIRFVFAIEMKRRNLPAGRGKGVEMGAIANDWLKPLSA